MQNKQPFTRVNKQIKFSPVIVISPDGNNLGKFPVERALQLAVSAELDLVEVSPNTRPPVCKIMDYGKYRYEQKLKLKEKNKSSSSKKNQIKEIRMKSRIDAHDLTTKINAIRKFIGEGHSVLVKILFLGRDIVHKDVVGNELENKIVAECADIGTNRPHKLEGRAFHFHIDPIKEN